MAIDSSKINREIKRIAQQMQTGLDRLLAPSRTRSYDGTRESVVTVTKGNQPLMRKVCIFLVYQPNGIAESILETCSFLNEIGLSVMLVSNLPISSVDHSRLNPVVWQTIERANIGYDFGGYREGILQLLDQNIFPDQLVILNDSVWLIRTPGAQFVSETLDLDADSAGSVLRVRRRKAKQYWIESYFLTFRKSTLQNPEFQAFWRNYPLLNTKKAVVRYGELHLGYTLQQLGFTLESKASNMLFSKALQDQPNPVLQVFLKYASLDGAFETTRNFLLKNFEDSVIWRSNALTLFTEAIKTAEFQFAFSFASVKLLNFPFVKKGIDAKYRMGRQQYLAAVNNGDLPMPSQTVLNEITLQVARDQEVFPNT
jgi:hypothetical protein